MTDTGAVAVGGTVVAVLAGVERVEGVAVGSVEVAALGVGAVLTAGGAQVPAAVASEWLGAGSRLQPPRTTAANTAMTEAARNEGRRFMCWWLERRSDGLAGLAGRDQPNVTPWKGQAETSLTTIR